MVGMLQCCNSFLKEMSISLLVQKASSNKTEYHALKKNKQANKKTKPYKNIKYAYVNKNIEGPSVTGCWKQL